MARLTVISSDGHAMARMRDYLPYLESELQYEFKSFLTSYETDERDRLLASQRLRLDPEEFDDWMARDGGDLSWLDGRWDPTRRLAELEREGVVAEVLFPDAGLPFEGELPFQAFTEGKRRSRVHYGAATRAHTRWLADFCSAAPERFAGMAVIDFSDVEAAERDIRWAHDHGLKGIVLPEFPAAHPLYELRYDRVWDLLEELGMPANVHIVLSGITDVPQTVGEAPDASTLLALVAPEFAYRSRQMLSQFIWGGVLDRHPNLKLVFTELGSDWVVPALRAMDYSFDGSYLRRDVRSVVRMPPSEYFRRQCWLGSSVLSRAEVEARHAIGVDRMMVGVDWPHHEGMWRVRTQDYLQATLGAARVPVEEAQQMLAGTAGEVFGFDVTVLSTIAECIGPKVEDVLTPPTADLFPRGDVHRPLC